MKRSAKENNFWIVYADLMAGLLFVFILLASAVLTKYIITQNNLLSKNSLLDEANSLVISKDALLKSLKTELSNLSAELANEQADNEELANKLADMSAQNEAELAKLELKDLQIAALIAANKQQSISIVNRSDKIKALKSDLENLKTSFGAVKDYKAKLIAKLSKQLDDSLLINLNSGELELPSKVLFESNSASLNEDSKELLAKQLNKYFKALKDANILKSLDAIIIEGHTDSDGGYLYNLELSSKRSLEILRFISSLNPPKEVLDLLSSVGKGYMDLRLDKFGNEDKAASRRIEIKLVFNNHEAIDTYEKRINDININ